MVESSGPALRRNFNELAAAFHRFGQHATAESLAMECVAISKAAAEPSKLAVDLTRAAHYSRSDESRLRWTGEALDLFDLADLDPAGQDYRYARSIRSRSLIRLGRPEEATLVASALIITSESERSDVSWLLEGLDVRCWALHKLGDFAGALEDVDRVLAIISGEGEDAQGRNVLRWLSEKAWILANLGRHYDAIAVLRELRLRIEEAGDLTDGEHAHYFNPVLSAGPEEILAAWRGSTGEDWPVRVPGGDGESPG